MTGSSGWRSLICGQQFETALAGQGKIEQHEIEVLEFEDAQALLAVGGHAHLVALERQQDFERLADAGFIVDDENAGIGGVVGSGGSGQDSEGSRPQAWTEFLNNGNSRWKVVPAPIALSTWILPACSWMMP